jgi:hypothetical protein
MNLRILQKLIDFRVIFCLDLLVIGEILFLAFMFIDLETMAVQIIIALIARYIRDQNILCNEWPFICVWLS